MLPFFKEKKLFISTPQNYGTDLNPKDGEECAIFSDYMDGNNNCHDDRLLDCSFPSTSAIECALERSSHDISLEIIRILKDSHYHFGDCLYFELRRILDPVLIASYKSDVLLKSLSREKKLLVSFSDEDNPWCYTNTYEESEDLLSKILLQKLNANKAPAETVNLWQSTIKKSVSGWYLLWVRDLVGVTGFLTRLIVMGLKNLFANKVIYAGYDVGRGLESILESRTFIKIPLPKKIISSLGVSFRKRIRAQEESKRFAIQLKDLFDSKGFSLKEITHERIMQLLDYSIISNRYSKILVLLLSKVNRRVIMINLHHSRVSEALACFWMKEQKHPVITYAHQLEGHAEAPLNFFIDEQFSNFKFVGGAVAESNIRSAGNKVLPSFFPLGLFIFKASGIHSRLIDYKPKKTKVILYLVATYPKTNFLMGSYRLLAKELVSRHRRLLAEFQRTLLTDDIHLIIRAHSAHKNSFSELHSRSIDSSEQISLSDNKLLRSDIDNADIILCDAPSTSFGEALCSLKPVFTFHNNWQFYPKSKSLLDGAGVLLDSVDSAVLKIKSELTNDITKPAESDIYRERFIRGHCYNDDTNYHFFVERLIEIEASLSV